MVTGLQWSEWSQADSCLIVHQLVDVFQVSES